MENLLVHTRPLAPRDWAVDAGVAAAAFAFGCVQLMLSASLILPDEALRRLLGIEAVLPSAGAYLALALTTVPLVARRRAPWVVFAFVLVAFLGSQMSMRGLAIAPVGPMVALFTIAAECSRAEALVGGAVALVGLLAVPAQSASGGVWLLSYVQEAALFAAAGLAGYALRSHRDYVRAVEQRAEEAERTREEEAARCVEEERVRIAREVHDITAHSLSAVSIQTAAAERLIDRDPAAAKEAVASARQVAKQALDEIRGMIGVLRAGDASAETAPTSGTDRLGDLVAYLRDAGIEATLDAARYRRDLVPAYLDVALYGIAREATTNIVRHARARTAALALATAGDAVTMTIENDGPQPQPAPAAAQSAAAGHGIQGMRERARLLGGSLEAAPRAGGGFRVNVRIPLPSRFPEGARPHAH